MKIAVTYENGNVFQHFGHTERFKVYDIENGAVIVATIINTNGSGHGALVDILKNCDVEKLICGGIGAGAKRALEETGIELFCGVSGNTDEQVEAFLRGELKHDISIECCHHSEHHHGQNCGNHNGGCAHNNHINC